MIYIECNVPIFIVPWLCEVPEHHDIFKLLRWTLNAVGIHFRLLYKGGVFLARADAVTAVECGWKIFDSWLIRTGRGRISKAPFME